MEISQGDIYWLRVDRADGAEADYAHPYVVIQDDVINRSRINTIVICALTSNLKRMSEPGNLSETNEQNRKHGI